MLKNLLLPAAFVFAATPAFAQVSVVGSTTTYHDHPTGSVDFVHPRPMPMPNAMTRAPLQGASINPQTTGPSGGEGGGLGDGMTNPVQVAPELKLNGGVAPQQFGTSGQPFTTAEAAGYGSPGVVYYPYRAAGRLLFNEGSATFLCSASFIKPGLLVTAAHCVAAYGQRHFYSNWVFTPAYTNGSAPYGVVHVSSARILTAYYAGTDGCYQSGVICTDDVALLTTVPTANGGYEGSHTGWFGYYYGGAGFNGSSQALISQLGYPCDLDSCALMQRNDSQGFTNATLSHNTIIGSLMTGGSSGGPWVVNLGAPPALSGGDTMGSWAGYNATVGVTSWGYTNLAVKQQGAAPFTFGNIQTLINADCSATPGAC